jgi:hypothetical protein
MSSSSMKPNSVYRPILLVPLQVGPANILLNHKPPHSPPPAQHDLPPAKFVHQRQTPTPPPPVPSPDKRQKPEIQPFRTARRRIRPHRSIRKHNPPDDPNHRKPRRSFQVNDRISRAKPALDRIGKIPVDHPGWQRRHPLHLRSEHLRRHLDPPRPPPDLIQMEHRQPETSPEMPRHRRLPAAGRPHDNDALHNRYALSRLTAARHRTKDALP